MKLDDKLNDLKNDIPDNDLDYKEIYKKATTNNNHTFIYKKRIMYMTLALISIFIISLCVMFPFVNKKNKKSNKDNKDNNLVCLIQDISENKVNIRPDTYDEFINKYNDFSAKITEEVINNSENNTISPYSIFSSLVLLSQVTDNNSKQEILDALNMTDELILNNYPYFYSIHNYSKFDQFNNETIEKTYNSIWIQKGLNVKQDAINNLTNNYYCYPYYIDYDNEKSANEIITKYVSKNTNGLIKENFDFSPNTIISMINTNYLSDVWGKDELEQSSKYSFTDIDNVVKRGLFNISKDFDGMPNYEDKYSYFYAKTNNYKINFILPNDGINIHDIFNKEMISKVSNNSYIYEDETYYYYTHCCFPSFKLESELIDLKDVLINKFNIKDIFNSNKSDLSKLLYRDAYFNKICHKAKVEVDKKGIKAASVTVSEIYESAGAYKTPKYLEFVLDKPFGIIISKNKEILYTGIVDKI